MRSQKWITKWRFRIFWIKRCSYITQLRDLNRKKIVEGNIERSRSLLKLAQDQLSAGAGVRIDVTRAEARVIEDERDLWIAEDEHRDIYTALKGAAGFGFGF